MSSGRVDLDLFRTEYEINPEEPMKPIFPRFTLDYMTLVSGIRIADWNALQVAPEFIESFPYFTQYLPAPVED
jgi:hypothetical protein